jgi:hypothetical protein
MRSAGIGVLTGEEGIEAPKQNPSQIGGIGSTSSDLLEFSQISKPPLKRMELSSASSSPGSENSDVQTHRRGAGDVFGL